jgi:hypothetical protein
MNKPKPPSTDAPGPVVVLFTEAGDLALVDGASGAVLASSPGGGLGGVRDAALDLAGERVVTFEGDDEATWGEIATYSLDRTVSPPALGPRVARAMVDGDARVAAAPGGILVFSDGPATQWRLLRDDGVPSSSESGPRPASLVLRDRDHLAAPDLAFDALAYSDDGALVLQSAVATAGSLAMGGATTLPVTPFAPPTARLAALPGLGVDVVVDASDAGLVLHAITNGAAGPAISIGLGSPPGRVEAALPILSGDAVAVLTSGTARVVIAGIAPGGGLADVAAVDLDGPVRVEDRFFSRDLAAVDDETLLAATETGVARVHVDGSTGDLAVSLDSSFDGAPLRGPIAGALP